MIREYVKWHYELRDARQLAAVVDRALAAAMTHPRGPVYLSLPRERLLDPVGELRVEARNRMEAGAASQPDPDSLARAAELIAGASAPVVVANQMGRDPEAVPALVALAEEWAIPVLEVFRESLNFPADHPLHLGFAPSPVVEHADLVIAIEADVPWVPRRGGPRPGTPVIQVAEDPVFVRYPMRTFPVDVGLAGRPALSLAALRRALAAHRPGRERSLAARREGLAARHRRHVEDRRRAAEAESAMRPIGMTWLSRCIGEIADDDTLVVNEYDLRSDQLGLNRPGAFLGSSAVSGLGWGFGAALGAKLAAPDRTVVCALGDGAYIFNNPVACHMAAAAEQIPVLVVVFNNRAWNAVRSAVADVAPGGWAVRGDDYALTALEPSPEFHRIAEACGGYGERVDDPAEVPRALQRALKEVRGGRHALLNVVCAL
jgi:acetolactate synthase-1/2/3 large subunit